MKQVKQAGRRRAVGTVLAAAPERSADLRGRKRPIISYLAQGKEPCCGHYAVRVDGVSGRRALISINSGPCLECRESAGHYWHDWAPSEARQFLIRAKEVTADGCGRKSGFRACKVI